MARLVVAAVAAAAAFYFSGFNPAAAAATFSLVYGVTGFLDPKQKILGPKLTDLKAPQANYGAVIPYLEGGPRLAGIIIWCSDKRPIANTQETGKGGPGVSNTTFTYEMDALYELAINQCQALRRVWSNGKLVWSAANDSSGSSLAASAVTPTWRDIRFYDGDSDQLPDPIYEAAVGVGNAPAYRERTTVMVEGLNLGGSGQLPVLTFEVVTVATPTMTVADFASIPQEGGSIIGQGASPFSALGFQVHVGQWNNGYSNSQVRVYDVSATGDVSFVTEYTANSNQPSGHGQTDVAGIMGILSFGPPEIIACWNELGDLQTAVVFTFRLPYTGTGSHQLRFAMRGDIVIFGNSNFGTSRLYRFSKGDGAANGPGAPVLATSPVLFGGSGSVFVCTNGTDVFALQYGGYMVARLDVATLTLQETITGPTNSTNNAIVCDEYGRLVFIGNNAHSAWLRVGSTWEERWPGGVPGYVADNSQFNVSNGVIFQMTAEGSPNPGNQIVHAYYQTVQQGQVTLDGVVQRLCVLSGQLTAADLDVTALSTTIVRALPVTQVSPIRTTLDMLMQAYLFECAEGEKLRFVPRGGTAVTTIPFKDLGASAEGDEEPLPIKRSNDIEIAARVSVRYANVDNDFQDGLEAADRLVTESTSDSLIEFPLGLKPAEAKKMAEAGTMDLAVALTSIGPISVPAALYSALEPTDPFNVVAADGSSFRVRATKATYSGGIVTLELVLDDALAIVDNPATDDDYVSSTLISAAGLTQLAVLDAPIFRDADNALGPYIAVDATDPWGAAQVFKGVDETNLGSIATLTDRTVIGRSTSILPAGPVGVLDNASTVLVSVDDDTLYSYSHDAVMTGLAAPYMLGAEVFFAQTATLVSSAPNVYRLSDLIRGQRGTEWAVGSHVAGEVFVWIQVPGMRKVTDPTSDLNASRYYAAVTAGRSLAQTPKQAFVDTGVALKPFAPADLRRGPETATLIVTWNRRSRLSSVFLGQAEVPLGEEVESYDAELRDPSNNVIASQGGLSSPSVEFGLLQVTAPDPLRDNGVGYAKFKTVSGNLVAIPYAVAATGGTAVVFGTLGASTGGNGTPEVSSMSGPYGDPRIGNNNPDWCVGAGDSMYFIVELFGYDSSPPYSAHVSSTLIRKYTKVVGSAMTGADATYTVGTVGDTKGIAYDGSVIWISERSNGLRTLNPTTLASTATYAVAGGLEQISYRSGKLYAACATSKELLCWDTTSHTDTWRVALSFQPFGILVTSSLVFVYGDGILETHSISTGALVTSFLISVPTETRNDPLRQIIAHGSQVAFFTLASGTSSYGYAIAFFDGTTGQQGAVARIPYGGVHGLSYSDGTYVFVIAANSPDIIRVHRLGLLSTDLTGYKVVVWQRSATVGRGYPATITL